jgi:hypothetical protein
MELIKMAQKDWEERESNIPTHIYESYNEKKDGLLWIQDTGKSFYVNISYFESGYWKLGKTKNFNSKEKAIKYTENYMRSH